MRLHVLPLSALLALGAACQEPFGADRHELVDLRVAGLKVRPVPESQPAQITATGALFVDGRPWADAPVDWRWRWVEDADALAALQPENNVHARGPASELELPEGSEDPLLGLLAVHEDGRVYRSMIRVPRDPGHRWPEIEAIEVARVEGTDLDSLAPEQVPAASRADWAATEGPVAPGDIARITVARGASAPNARARWMSAGGAGTFLELDRARADWVAGAWAYDDEEVTEATPLAAGWVTGFTLLLDDLGGADYRAWDLPVGVEPIGLFTPRGRFLPAEAPFAGGLVRGTLVADDSAPFGLRLERAAMVRRDELPRVDPFGTSALACEIPVAGPFDPDWLLEGRCLRGALDGAVVVVEAR